MRVEHGGALALEPSVSGSSAAGFHREGSIAACHESAGVGFGLAGHATGLAGQVLDRRAGLVGVHPTDDDSLG